MKDSKYAIVFSKENNTFKKLVKIKYLKLFPTNEGKEQ